MSDSGRCETREYLLSLIRYLKKTPVDIYRHIIKGTSPLADESDFYVNIFQA